MDRGKLAGVFLGVLAGAIVGFVYGSGVRSRLSQSVETDISGGNLTVSVNLAKAAFGFAADRMGS